jgi:hypothetical protein
MQRLSGLADDALLESLHALVGSHRRVMADLIAHLSEVDARRLQADKGFSSLFGYCVERLGFSEDEACRRIEAARLMRRFPEIFSLLQGGAISLTTLGLLKHHLTIENHRDLLAGISGSTVRQAKEWLAARFPVADVPQSIRKLPVRAVEFGSPQSSAAAASATDSGNTAESLVATDRLTGDAGPFPACKAMAAAGTVAARSASVDAVAFQAASAPADAVAFAAPSASADAVALPASSATADASARSAAALPAPKRVIVEPLSRDRFLVKFTASRVMREKLALACDLMRHANPAGDLSVVFERALELLVADLEKRKQGRTKRPRGEVRAGLANSDEALSRTNGHSNAAISRAARREVVARHGWRCSFVAEDGKRCDARAFVEFDHETPKGLGGTSQPENLRLLCRAHNRLAAERVYGRAHVATAIERARGKGGEWAR